MAIMPELVRTGHIVAFAALLVITKGLVHELAHIVAKDMMRRSAQTGRAVAFAALLAITKGLVHELAHIVAKDMMRRSDQTGRAADIAAERMIQILAMTTKGTIRAIRTPKEKMKKDPEALTTMARRDPAKTARNEPIRFQMTCLLISLNCASQALIPKCQKSLVSGYQITDVKKSILRMAAPKFLRKF